MSIMASFSRFTTALVLAIVTAVALERLAAEEQARADGPRVEIVFSKDARSEPVTGMVYVAISRDNARSPIEQTSPTGVPLFSRYVEGLVPGTAATITSEDRGHPLQR